MTGAKAPPREARAARITAKATIHIAVSFFLFSFDNNNDATNKDRNVPSDGQLTFVRAREHRHRVLPDVILIIRD
jgi:hypothetical protein